VSAPRSLLLVQTLALLLLAPAAAQAHQVGLSRGVYRAQGGQLDAEMVFQNGELAAAVNGSDSDRDGALSEAEIKAALPAIEGLFVQQLQVRGDEQPCPGKLSSARLVEGDGIELRSTHRCAAAPRSWSVEIDYLERLAHGHRQLSSLESGRSTADAVTFAASRSLRLTPGPTPASSAAPQAPEAAHAAPSSVSGLFLLGVEHILTGYDHLVFLLGLVLVGGRLRSLVGVITAFTVAHSLTLALAALRLWSPGPRLVEPAIALSIAYIGVENFFVKNAEGRWRVTFPFGLIHGFGFAGVLAEIALPAARIPQALLFFNLGVEAGQLAVMLPLLGLLHLLRRLSWFERHGVRALSVLIILAGLGWFFQRVLGGD
jgi:hydrogenase/urease accessory protein HupE